ncbi:MAG: cupin domain-containing protein [Chloroflexi bacterium]|nr:cupin domain-containing protein [Chloroflexota bacterium]
MDRQDDSSAVNPVLAGEDCFASHRGLGISAIAFKVAAQDSSAVFIIENTFHSKGGPARHLHFEQEEWFYAVEGEFLLEIGSEQFLLKPGDSVLAPRQVPHVWAHVGEGLGRMLIVFTPAGQMEAFFREVTRENAMPAQDPELWRRHGMELLGPPLRVE